MGLVYADIELVNAGDIEVFQRGYIKGTEIRTQNVKVLVNSGAYTLCINENIKNQLGLRKVHEMEAELANGKIEKVDMVGPITIRIFNRMTNCNAAVFPGDTEVLLGWIPLEDMDLILDSKEEVLKLPEDRKYLAKKKIK
ncbi:MAG: retroviral-like aspartic protease family protein [Verrucomicrobiota bacterium]|nr:retroviral-like aspartic protease family protein [Verrucomicrobiota bacterium]